MHLYQLENRRICDSWYCKNGDTYHSFFLECTCTQNPLSPFDDQKVGHMTSRDLAHWQYEGVALRAQQNTWNDSGIATGSVAFHDGRWYMIFSGDSVEDRCSGSGIAVSDDLMTWEKQGDGPVIRKYKSYPFEHEGRIVRCCPLADPYIYPEPLDGHYYIFVNSWSLEHPFNQRGATTIFRTRDFVTFTPYKIAALHSCDRMETVQVWKHGDTYYMYAGCVTITAPPEANVLAQKHFEMITHARSENQLLTSKSLEGPYAFCQKLEFPDEADCSWLYIAKVLADPEGKDVMLVNDVPTGIVGPYAVLYQPDGTIRLERQ